MDQRRQVDADSQSAADIRGVFGLTADRLAPLALLRDIEAIDPESLVAAFYRWLEVQPWKQRFFPAGVPAAVRTAQVRYWREFLAGAVDEVYISGRRLVGETHARIGLPPKAYTSAMVFAERWLGDAVQASALSVDDQLAVMRAISLLGQFDSALVMDAYSDHSNRRIQAEADSQLAINREVMRVVVEASEGNFSDRYRPRGAHDQPLGSAINQMLANVAATIDQVKAVAEGDYSTTVVPRSGSDQLGRVLAEMTGKLRAATERTRHDQWLKQGQSDVFMHMRGELGVDELARGVLSYLALRTGASAGCLYVKHEQRDSWKLAATYGVLADGPAGQVRRGQGIIGEVAHRREQVFDLDISSSPIRVSYGLGDIALTRVAIVPLVANDAVCGILQLASAAPLDTAHRELLALVAENIAIALAAASARTEMRSMLERLQIQSEELQAQAEELRASNEGLEERGRALVTAREELEGRNAELQREQAAVQRAQAALEERARDLSQASRYKSEFLANISHELRTPLNSMLILADGLCANPTGNLTDKQIESLDIIRGGGRDLSRIINDILDLSKVEAGQLSVQIEAVSLEHLVRYLRRQFEPVASKAGLSLDMELAPGLPTAIRSDDQRVQQILKNLLANALKFTHEGSVRLVVRPAALDVRFQRADLDARTAIAMSVIDTGIGISPEKQRDIFEAFQQADGSTSRKYGGTGLGLTVSRQLAKLLGGEIHVASAPGRGSTFTLYLPREIADGAAAESPAIADAPAAPPSTAAPPAPPASDRAAADPGQTSELAPAELDDDRDRLDRSAPVVLIVEDDPVFAGVLIARVRAHGYKAIRVGTGRDAMFLVETREVNGVVLDLGLPDIDGMTVLSSLKGKLSTRHVPIHVISGHACRPESLRLGAIGFLEKPVDHAGLTAMFERFEQIWSRPSRRVLVVEDDAANQAALRELLTSRGVAIDVVGTGADGLRQLAQARYDCMVVDLRLPDMNGTEFLDQLPDDHPPVIVNTAQDLSDSELHRLSEYTRSVVVKGTRSPERLLDEVSLFLHQVESGLSEVQKATLHKLHRADDVLQGTRVLVVDDDMRNLFAMTELLQRHGVEVIKAKNGQIALERLDASADIDLVIMDVMMPVMDGLEAMRRIRAQLRFARLPIIALTAKTLLEDRQACLEAGASDYITKPMDPANLLALMRVILFDARRSPQGTAGPGREIRAS